MTDQDLPDGPTRAPYVALDLETRDPQLTTIGPFWISPALTGPDAYVLGIAASWGDRATPAGSVYVPIGHQSGNTPTGQALDWLRAICRASNVKIFANAQYDVGHIHYTLGVHDWGGEIQDVQIQAPLLDEQRRSYSLDSLAKTWLGGDEKDTTTIDMVLAHLSPRERGANLWRLTPEQITDYATHDTRLTYCLWHLMQEQLREQDLLELSALEHALLWPLIQMRRRGVRVDMQQVDALRAELLQRIDTVGESIRQLTGRSVHSAWISQELAEAFIQRGLTPPVTPKTGAYSITREWLSEQSDPLAQHVMELRRCSTILQTFINGHMGYVLTDAHGDPRIHASWHQLRSDEGGTVTGRLSSSNPNLQNIPARDEYWGPRVRSIFLPESGQRWATLDYSSQEPRLTAAVAQQLGCPGADELVKAWCANPRLDLHQWTADLMQVPRKVAKAINLGLTYGMGGGKLARQLGLPYTATNVNGQTRLFAGPEAKALLQSYYQHLPFVRCALQRCSELAQQRGFVRTLRRRRVRFPIQADGTRWSTHKALNAIIQGSAADQMKQALVDCWRAGYVPLLTVHDELDFSFRDDSQLDEIEHLMRAALPLPVPTIVDRAVGANWGDAT